MPMPRMMTFWKAIDMLEAQEMILGLKVAEYPNMEDKDKRKLLEEFKNKAYFKDETKEDATIIRTDQIAAIIGNVNV